MKSTTAGARKQTVQASSVEPQAPPEPRGRNLATLDGAVQRPQAHAEVRRRLIRREPLGFMRRFRALANCLRDSHRHVLLESSPTFGQRGVRPMR